MPNAPTLRRLTSKIERCSADFGLDLTRPGAVACSGGKDSTALLFLLRELGVYFHPAIVDLGYNGFDAAGIERALAAHGFRASILTPPSDPSTSRGELLSNLALLRDPHIKSPCGPCSQAKRHILTDFAVRAGVSWIAMGHHRDDFLTTILKDYFVERYYAKYGPYDHSRFNSFVRSEPIDLVELQAMVNRGIAATMAIRLPLTRGLSLFRPMAYILEHDLAELTQTIGIAIHGSGCSHNVFQNPGAVPSKREIVHDNLSKRLDSDPALGDVLLNVALSSLDPSGRPRFHPRQARPIRCPDFGA